MLVTIATLANNSNLFVLLVSSPHLQLTKQRSPLKKINQPAIAYPSPQNSDRIL
ncbi:MAG: hypothetical protein ACKPCM_16800 [Pseudanabaena sp.]